MEEFLIQQQHKYRGVPTTASSLGRIKFEDGVGNDKKSKAEIMWEVFKHGLGY